MNANEQVKKYVKFYFRCVKMHPFITRSEKYILYLSKILKEKYETHPGLA